MEMKFNNLLRILMIIVIWLAGLNTAMAAIDGFVLRWKYVSGYAFTSISPVDIYSDYTLGGVMAGSVDNNVYFFDSGGNLTGSYEANSTITSVASFIHDGDNKFNDGVAGSLDNTAYAFWRPRDKEYFKSAYYWWSFDAEDDVYAVAAFDYNRTGQMEGILVGMGKYASDEGKVYALNYTGGIKWSLSTSAHVKVFSSGDMASNGLLDHVLVGAGKTLTVLKYDGTSLWDYSFPDDISAISPADLSGNLKLNGILVGAGSKVYALNAKKEKLWEHDFTQKVMSLSYADVNNDKIIDYYLIAAGSRLYGVKADEKGLTVLWNYDTGMKIDFHVGVDFDRDMVIDDVALISGNLIYAYDHVVLYLPKIRVSKSISKSKIGLGDNFTVAITVENTGDGKALNLVVQDVLPEGFNLVKGSTAYEKAELSPTEIVEFSYTANSSKAGGRELPGAEARFSDSYGIHTKILSSPASLIVAEKEAVKGVGAVLPKIDASRRVSKSRLSFGEEVRVNIFLKNEGNGSALNVTFEESIPNGLVLVKGNASWTGKLLPKEHKELSYALLVKRTGRFYTLPQLEVTYRDSEGGVYKEVQPEIRLEAVKRQTDYKSLLLLVPVLVLFSLIVLMKKKGLLR